MKPKAPISDEGNRDDAGARWIRVRNARTHNLKGVSLDLPRDRLIAITGLSGSGKSSLAFDTLFAEGQRKYVESLSAYARQFLGPMAKPDADQISGLPPTIAIAQQAGRSNPRSTVATTTEVYDFLRLLYARVATPHCPSCGREVRRETLTRIVDDILAAPEGAKVMILAPLARNAAGDHAELLGRIGREGFVRARIDGALVELREAPRLDKGRPHTIEAVVDRLVMRRDLRARLSDSVETAAALSGGLVTASFADAEAPGGWRDEAHTERYACLHCDVRLADPEPRLFSFNSPHGACAECDGLGTRTDFDPERVVKDATAAVGGGALALPRGREGAGLRRLVAEFCERWQVPPDTPYERIPARLRRILLRGTEGEDTREDERSFEGVLRALGRRYEETDSDELKTQLHAWLSDQPCPACGGARLNRDALSFLVQGRTIRDVTRQSIAEAAAFFEGLGFDGEQAPIAEAILREIRRRLRFMLDVGLGYLTLDRASGTLSGGEAQRIRLATQIGSGLVGVCYVLDEPTTGLHQRDTERLLATIRDLRDLGNTIVVVEHDAEVIRGADWWVDVGPGAGEHGGQILANGPAAEVLQSRASTTAAYIRGDAVIATPATRRPPGKRAIEIKGAKENNLKGIDVRIPLGLFTCVTGVSGSGKSTLVNRILLPAVRQALGLAGPSPGLHGKVMGTKAVERVIEIDQSPIGRSPRSNAATYTGIFDRVRDLFAATREARLRGYGSGRFSFNTKGGRCEACAGQGVRLIEMHFLPDLYVPCGECKGTRYNRETLEIRFRGKTIAEVLDMRIEEASGFFDAFSAISATLKALDEVGLGYLALGQPGHTLSGGEAQRIKLAAELGKQTAGHTLYVLDEPTTGLHFEDIRRLLAVLGRLSAGGHTIVVIEHNLDVIRQADWIIDLGPEGGEAGGEIVAEGTPEAVAGSENSHTGRYLRGVLDVV